jgi:hypothetical protein
MDTPVPFAIDLENQFLAKSMLADAVERLEKY